MNLHQPLGFAPAGDPVNFPSTCCSTLTDLSEGIQLGRLPKVWASTSLCLGRALETRQNGLNAFQFRKYKKLQVKYLINQPSSYPMSWRHQFGSFPTRLPWYVYLKTSLWPADRLEVYTFVHLCPRAWLTHTGALPQNIFVWKLSRENFVTRLL